MTQQRVWVQRKESWHLPYLGVWRRGHSCCQTPRRQGAAVRRFHRCSCTTHWWPGGKKTLYNDLSWHLCRKTNKQKNQSPYRLYPAQNTQYQSKTGKRYSTWHCTKHLTMIFCLTDAYSSWHNGRHHVSQLASSRTNRLGMGAQRQASCHFVSQLASSRTNRMGLGSQWQASYQSVCRQ